MDLQLVLQLQVQVLLSQIVLLYYSEVVMECDVMVDR